MLGYVTGVYDILRLKDLQKLDMIIQKNIEKGNKYFAIALYDEELCEALGISEPLKSIEDRIKIVEQLSGVDFAFKISSLDKDIIQDSAQAALTAYEKQKIEEDKDKKEDKQYDIVYAPGTYDLFHAGHLENLLEAANKSKRLIVGVKADELVYEHKGRKPMITAEERMEILRHFKFVDNVYQYFTRDPHTVASWIKSKYNKDVEAIFLGSDLREDFKNIKDIPLVFTERDEKNMANRSTSGYIKKLKIRTLDENTKYKGSIKKSSEEKENVTEENNQIENLNER